MAYLKLYRKKLQANYKVLQKMFDKADIDWGVVTKVLCGNRRYLQELVDLGIKEMHDTRISNLKAIKAIAPDVQTVYIKPPAKRSWENVVKFADVSFNTELATIRGLSVEAVKQKRIHKVIIMVAMAAPSRPAVVCSAMVSSSWWFWSVRYGTRTRALA